MAAVTNVNSMAGEPQNLFDDFPEVLLGPDSDLDVSDREENEDVVDNDTWPDIEWAGVAAG